VEQHTLPEMAAGTRGVEGAGAPPAYNCFTTLEFKMTT